MPYVKQSFVGGPNSIRAFEFRSLGPGRYTPSTEEDANPIEQSGDVKILINFEYRFTMYKFLKAALFADAGNVWLRKDDPDRPNGEFKVNSFYKELALGTGMGIRLDFDFFAIRIDLGIPVYIPYNDDGDRWIHQFPESNFKDWRKANWAWNIAIGYPF
jgi:outer membrane protein assembly factor BamA